MPTPRSVRPDAARPPFAARPCTVVLCRGCCCGTERKRPGADHDGQLALLREAVAASGGRLALLTTDCLGPCSEANIVVLRPSAEGRRRGGRAVWISEVLDRECTEEVLAWAAAGGPGLAPAPAALRDRLIDPPRELWQRSRGRNRG